MIFTTSMKCQYDWTVSFDHVPCSVSNSDWIGGTSYYSNLEEGNDCVFNLYDGRGCTTYTFPSGKLLVCTYPFLGLLMPCSTRVDQNGMVPNAFLMNDTTRIAQVQQFLDHVLTTQQSDGWLGPETGSKPRYLWGRFLNSLLL